MKFVLLFFLLSLNLTAQDENKIHYRDLVEAYYDNDSKRPLNIYDSINGQVVNTFNVLEGKTNYYKIAILESEYGWFKIKNIQRLPSDAKDYGYENFWVQSKDFIIHIDNYDEDHRVYLYDLPTKKSNRIHKLDNFQITSVIETSDLWAKVKCKIGNKKIEGWLDFKDQCAYPWTTCIKNE
ncbi:hypothetical protein [Psychroserpens sp. Hel_I_66]|uniref:hypothetical protein n=1 Tax=Psychroserpens sp. Hel_I_66 TaxID=1250004 RepID=UPI000645D6AB|nr:hypothetical protein [Psychroserpens sp. Hel_I_66]